jgi:replicative DNA helicase
MDLQIPIIIGSQLNREAAKRGKPTLADLRESGAIEQDSDIVLLLSRSEEGPESTIDVAKHRGGATGEITMQMNGAQFRFESNYDMYDHI